MFDVCMCSSISAFFPMCCSTYWSKESSQENFCRVRYLFVFRFFEGCPSRAGRSSFRETSLIFAQGCSSRVIADSGPQAYGFPERK